MESGHQEDQAWNFQVQPPPSRERRGVGNEVYNWSCLHKEASIKSQELAVQRGLGLMNTWGCWKNDTPREDTEVLCPFTHTLPYTSLQPGCSSVSFIVSFNKMVNVSKCLSSISYSRKLIKPKEKVVGTPNLELVGQKHKMITWVCYWYLKGGGAGGETGSLMGLSPYLWDQMLSLGR